MLRGTDTQWATGWTSDTLSGTLTPTARRRDRGRARRDPATACSGYQLWLGGSFDRGFDVKVDGRPIGSVADALDPIGAYERVGAPLTLAAGVHTITVTYPAATSRPGSADTEQLHAAHGDRALAAAVPVDGRRAHADGHARRRAQPLRPLARLDRGRHQDLTRALTGGIGACPHRSARCARPPATLTSLW